MRQSIKAINQQGNSQIMDWEKFQKLAIQIQPILMPGFQVKEDIYEFDNASIKRQLDGVMRNPEGTYPLKILIEATLEKVDLANIDSKISKARRLSVDKLIVISAKGFTADAIKSATSENVETWILRADTDDDWEGLVQIIQIHTELLIPRYKNFNIKTKGSPGNEIKLEFSQSNRDLWIVYGENGNIKANLWDFFKENAGNEGHHEFNISPGDYLYVKGKTANLAEFSFDVTFDKVESPLEIDLKRDLIGIYVNAQDPTDTRFIPRPPGFQGALP